MAEDFSTVLEQLPVQEFGEQKSSPNALRWFELGLVLLIAFGMSILTAIYMLRGGTGAGSIGAAGKLGWTVTIVHEAGALLLLGYVLSRRGLRIRDLGLSWSGRDLVKGPLVTIAGFVAYYVSYFLLNWAYHLLFHGPAAGLSAKQAFGHTSVLMAVMTLINPFFEELIVRAYLMTEVHALTGSWMLAVVASTALQTAYHLYYGWVGALAVGTMFLVFSIYYARTQRATPVIFGHCVSDWLALIALR